MEKSNTNVHDSGPASERQARPLKAVKDPEQRAYTVRLWGRAIAAMGRQPSA